MRIRIHFATLRAVGLLHLAACVASILMLLAFPIRPVHQFANHFRTPEVRRSMERHTPVAQPEAGPAESIAHQAVLPALVAPVDTGDVITPIGEFELSSEIPLSRLLLRLKLGPSRAGDQDPLL